MYYFFLYIVIFISSVFITGFAQIGVQLHYSDKYKLESTLTSKQTIKVSFYVSIAMFIIFYINLSKNIFGNHIGKFHILITFILAVIILNFEFKKLYNLEKKQRHKEKINKKELKYELSKGIYNKIIELIRRGIIREKDISNEVVYTKEKHSRKRLYLKIEELMEKGYFDEFSKNEITSFFSYVNYEDWFINLLREKTKQINSKPIFIKILDYIYSGKISEEDISNNYVKKNGRNVTKFLAKVIELDDMGAFDNFDENTMNSFYTYVEDGKKLNEMFEDISYH